VWYLLAGTRGGESRAKILLALRARPYNAHQLARLLNLDYKTITHHLKALLKNELVVSLGGGSYGAPYMLSQFMDANFDLFREIWQRLEKKK
jgi:predicted transcriptional regulator